MSEIKRSLEAVGENLVMNRNQLMQQIAQLTEQLANINSLEALIINSLNDPRALEAVAARLGAGPRSPSQPALAADEAGAGDGSGEIQVCHSPVEATAPASAGSVS